MTIDLESYCQGLLNQIQEAWGDRRRNRTLIEIGASEKQYSAEIAARVDSLLAGAYPESKIDVTVDGFRRLNISQN